MSLTALQIEQISQTVTRRFPEMRGRRPVVKAQPATKTTGASDARYTLVFKASALTSDGKSLPRTVRVLADSQGRVLKISTSR